MGSKNQNSMSLIFKAVHYFYFINAEDYSVYFSNELPDEKGQWNCIVYKGEKEIHREKVPESTRVQAGEVLAKLKLI